MSLSFLSAIRKVLVPCPETLDGTVKKMGSDADSPSPCYFGTGIPEEMCTSIALRVLEIDSKGAKLLFSTCTFWNQCIKQQVVAAEKDLLVSKILRHAKGRLKRVEKSSIWP